MITLSSDFGTPYPAAMKGVILTRCDARLIDIAHDFPRHDIRTAAFWLAEVLPEFPPAVHLIVVDPGVGTDRDAIVVRAGDHVLIGPDNGVVLPPARALTSGGTPGTEYDSDIDAYILERDSPASSTFHGRDVFAPGAAAIHEAGIDRLPELDGITSADDITDFTLPEADVNADGASGEVLVVDDFGNVITNIPGDVIADHTAVQVNGASYPVVTSYAHAAAGDAVVTIGSHNNVELAVTQGRGDDHYDLTVGDTIDLHT